MEVSVDIWKSQKKAGGLPAAGISISRYRDRGRKDSEDYRSEALKQQLEACSSIEEIFDMISLEYKDYYFLEISALLHDDQTLYSHLLKKDNGYSRNHRLHFRTQLRIFNKIRR
mgnify:CR=1 FL=1